MRYFKIPPCRNFVRKVSDHFGSDDTCQWCLRSKIGVWHLQEMARTMINENNLAKHFRAEAVNTTCYVQNRIYIRPILEKTAYALFKGRRPNISYFHQFGCTCYILNNKFYLKKFDAKAPRGIFLGYSKRSKAYKVYN